MGRASTRQNKNIYQRRREELGLTRERASELLDTIPPERIERIESEKSLPRPEEILTMSKGYKMPQLCNYYCANECPIGQRYVPEVKPTEFAQTVVSLLSKLNSMQKKQNLLLDISADGKINDYEIKDFIQIQEELEQISMAVEGLQLWTEQMIQEGNIDLELYEKYRQELQEQK